MGKPKVKIITKRNADYNVIFTKSEKRVKRKRERKELRDSIKEAQLQAKEEAKRIKEEKKAAKKARPKKKKEKVFNSYKDFQEEYLKVLLKAELKKAPKAYKVIFKNNPTLAYLSFKSRRQPALWEACAYFRDNLHPDFLVTFRKMLSASRGYRMHDLDKYAQEGRAPIPDILKVTGMTLSCSVCGKHKFTYEDYIKDRCYIIEGEGDSLPYAKGHILCYKCYQRYIERTK